MDSKALASAIDPTLLNVLSSDEDVASVSSHAEITVLHQNLDVACAETAEETRLLLATKTTFQEFYSHMKSRQRIYAAAWLPRKRKSKEETSLYMRLHALRRRYNGGVPPLTTSPLSLQEMWLLSKLPGVLGEHTFGEVRETVVANWSWVITDAEWEIESEVFPTQQAAQADLRHVQLELFPDWYDPSKRKARVSYLKMKIEEERRHSSLADHYLLNNFPLDVIAGSTILSAPSFATNYFTAFRNLGNTCFMNAMLQCFFHCTCVRFHMQLDDTLIGVIY